MKQRKTLKFLMLFLILSMLAFFAVPVQGVGRSPYDDIVPPPSGGDFTIDAIDGSEFTLSDKLGKIVLITWITPVYNPGSDLEDPCNILAQLKELLPLANYDIEIITIAKCDWHYYGKVIEDHPAVYSNETEEHWGEWVLVDFPSKDECRDSLIPILTAISLEVGISWPVAVDIPPAFDNPKEYWELYGSPDYDLTSAGGMIENIFFFIQVPTTVVINSEGMVAYRNPGLISSSELINQVESLGAQIKSSETVPESIPEPEPETILPETSTEETSNPVSSGNPFPFGFVLLGCSLLGASASGVYLVKRKNNKHKS